MPAQAASVQLEELTWTDLLERVAGGATTVLIPIGGTEQSGPHMTLGKHNVRVKLRFYIADMYADGVHIVDGASFKQVDFIATGLGPHGLYPSRDGKRLYVANRGSHKIHGSRRGNGGVAVIDFATEKIVTRWGVPGGGSPDMGNVSADGKYLWLAARYDDVIYRFDTDSGAVERIKVGAEPHGLTVSPQPGRYSLGHTGNLR